MRLLNWILGFLRPSPTDIPYAPWMRTAKPEEF